MEKAGGACDEYAALPIFVIVLAYRLLSVKRLPLELVKIKSRAPFAVSGPLGIKLVE